MTLRYTFILLVLFAIVTLGWAWNTSRPAHSYPLQQIGPTITVIIPGK